jgi:hypothetical protein
MNPPHRYPTRFQAKFQAKLAEMLEQRKHIYEVRKQECIWEENPRHSQHLLSIIDSYEHATYRHERVDIVINAYTYILHHAEIIQEKTKAVLLSKIKEYREVIATYQSEQSIFDAMQSSINTIKSDIQNKKTLQSSMIQVNIDRDQLMKKYGKLEDIMQMLETVIEMYQ